ncbi:hypothetical protein DIURU_002316 [Diutina rugosa]|uniref:HECT-type E3 ubiquitin transferase n=1 Tax=Diutina rugosa TaxID=5481 RepID=A0A642UXM1_DIURU|nr:uncharacterized protein DIURU_002316 [Diutina rugosa]KAA8903804.1 hypothetical protein DIURU_002316 [Diutina rugosa]
MAFITVTIVKADSLRRTSFYKPSPYVSVTIDGGRSCQHTRVRRKCANPVWGDKFSFPVGYDSKLDLEILDHNRATDHRHHKLGSLQLRLSEILSLTTASERMMVAKLDKSRYGTIFLMLYSQPHRPLPPLPTSPHTQLASPFIPNTPSEFPYARRVSNNDSVASSQTSNYSLEPRHPSPTTDISLSSIEYDDLDSTPQWTGQEGRYHTNSGATSKDKALQSARAQFSNKVATLRASPQMTRRPGNKTYIRISRKSIVDDAFDQLAKVDADSLKGRLDVRFSGEEGIDAGGVSKEFFEVLTKAIFEPNLCLFKWGSNNTYAYSINPDSGVNPTHLDYFHFAGRVFGMAVFHNYHVGVVLVDQLYRQLLDMPVELGDIEAIDEDVYRSMMWLLENDITGVDLGLYFVVDYDYFGVSKSIELIPQGSTIPVTESNKHQYVSFIAQWLARERTRSQFRAFSRGFYEFVPQTSISTFTPSELEWLLSGSGQIDLDDWKANTLYLGYDDDCTTIRWFWEVVAALDNDKRVRLLQFVTGSTRAPPQGFSQLHGSDGPRKFTISKTTKVDHLPLAQTCFNKLSLPNYETKAQLQQKLTMLVDHCVGFGMG